MQGLPKDFASSMAAFDAEMNQTGGHVYGRDPLTLISFAGQYARTTYEFSTVAAGWYRYAQGYGSSAHRFRKNWERAMAQAEQVARFASDWIMVGVGWRSLGDAGRASSALQRGMSMSPDFEGWVVIAQEWRNLGDIGRSGWALEKAEGLTQSESDRLKMAARWHSVGNDQRAQKILEVGRDLNKSSQWVVIGMYWLGFESAGMAGWSLENAEPLAKSMDEWFEIATGWHKIGTQQRACSALERVESLSDSLDNRASTAARWKLIGEEVRARTLMEATESIAKDPNSCLRLAVGWHNLGDDGRAQTFLERGVGLSGTAKWTLIADFWRTLGNRSSAGWALDKAEALAKDSEEWGQIGAAWRTIGDEVRAQRAMSFSKNVQMAPLDAGARPTIPSSLACSTCGQPTTFVAQQNRYFCYRCGIYS